MEIAAHVLCLLPELRAYARSVCRSPDVAEDLVQDAIERALRSRHGPARVEDARPWMFRIIRNLRIDELRKRRVRRDYLAAQCRLLTALGSPSDTARDVMVRLAYRKLSPAAREVVFLVDVLGMRYAEAARVMDVPIGTVMSRISRARAALLALLDNPQGTARDGDDPT